MIGLDQPAIVGHQQDVEAGLYTGRVPSAELALPETHMHRKANGVVLLKQQRLYIKCKTSLSHNTRRTVPADANFLAPHQPEAGV